MDETTGQIEEHIHATRSQLGSNLHDLEHKVKSAMDWRTYFEEYPIAMLGAAFGGGVLLAALLGGKSPRSRADEWNHRLHEGEPQFRRTESNSESAHKLSATLNSVKTALASVAAAKVGDFLSTSIPGFREHFDRSEREKSMRSLQSRPMESNSAM